MNQEALMTTPAPQSLTWFAKSLSNSSKTTPELQNGALDLSSNKLAAHDVFKLPTLDASVVVSAAAPALLYHVHIVTDVKVIFRIKETIGGGEIDLEGTVLFLSAGQAATGLNLLSVEVINPTLLTANVDVFHVKGTA